MKKILITLTTIIGFVTAQAQYKNFIDQPYLEVNGKYDTLITPNEIFLKIIISEKDNKGKVSVEQQEKNVIDALKKLNINTEKDLMVSDMSSNFKFYALKKTDIFTSKEYSLKVSDAKILSKVFVSLEALGISNSSIDRVDHSDLEKIKNEARSKAIENAKLKAIALTKPLNQTIGAAIHIVDNEQYYNNILQGKVAGVQIRGYSSFDVNKQEEPADIDFEKIKITSSISVIFILK
jgi:uncharacterized protein YggE